MDERQPLVSVIVTSYSMERLGDLTAMLDSLAQQTYRQFEVIAVLEKSHELLEKAREYLYQEKYFNARLIFNSGVGGLSEARNLGVKKSRGEIIAFIDDDARAYPEWLANITKTFLDNDNIIGVTGAVTPIWETQEMSWVPEEFYWIFACTGNDDGRLKEVRNGYGTNMAFRKEGFAKSGLFLTWLGSERGSKGSQQTTAEETELALRMRLKTNKPIVYNPKVRVAHNVFRFRLEPKYIRKRSYVEGYSKAILKKLFRNNREVGTLKNELDLVKRIFFRLIPNIVLNFPRKPIISWRRMNLTLTVLIYITIGYFHGSCHHIENKEQNW